MDSFSNEEKMFLFLLKNKKFKDAYGCMTFLSMHKLSFKPSQLKEKLELNHLVCSTPLKEYNGEGFSITEKGIKYLNEMPKEILESLFKEYPFLNIHKEE